MAYQVLARKWRPKQFEEVVGQGHVTRTLQNAIKQEKLAHAYLFTGTRGVGKTSIARLFAKAIRCEIASLTLIRVLSVLHVKISIQVVLWTTLKLMEHQTTVWMMFVY